MKLQRIHKILDDMSREIGIGRMSNVEGFLAESIELNYIDSLAREFDRLDVVINVPVDDES